MERLKQRTTVAASKIASGELKGCDSIVSAVQ